MTSTTPSDAAEERRYWTGVLLDAQDGLVQSIGQPMYFEYDGRIRQARRELRRLEKAGAR